jgi:hypothetical protein
MFVILRTHSDLAFVVGIETKFSSGPKHVHCNVVLRILKYLKATMHYKLCYYGGNNNHTLTALVDANYKSDLMRESVIAAALSSQQHTSNLDKC